VLSRDPQPVLTAALPNSLKIMGGSELPEFNHALLNATVATISGHDPEVAASGSPPPLPHCRVQAD